MNETLFYTAYAGVLGLIIGSFLNVCISRLPYDESVVSPRSHCPNCAAPIAWYDNIPVVSFLILLARCRHCRERISFRYPTVELLTGLIFAAIVFHFGPGWHAFKWCLFATIQLELVFSDLETRILPDEFTKGGMIAGFAMASIVPLPGGIVAFLPALVMENPSEALRSLVNSLVSAGFLSGGLYLIGVTYQRLRGREGLGFGDVKMVGMMGAFLGLETALLGMMVGSLLGSVLGMVWITLRRASAADYELPFGSFLGIGAMLAVASVLAGV